MELDQHPQASLAFGDHQARRLHSLVEAQDEAARLLPGLHRFDPFEVENFQFKTSLAVVNGLVMAAATSPPSQMLFAGRLNPAFVFPFSGRADFLVEKSVLTMQANHKAIFVPPGISNDVRGSNRSVVVAQVNPSRLESTLRVMLGVNFHESLVSRLGTLTDMKLSCGDISFDEVFRHVFSMIDSYRGNKSMLEVSGIDDIFYRTLAIALLPDVFAIQKEAPISYRTQQVKEVCDYVMENLHTCITLTDLERLGHMSRRTIHNAFFRTFGLSPMQWVRNQRLLKAQSILSNPRNCRSITEVLYTCGFTQPSLFSTYYRRRFGESPSQTVMIALGKR